jgi:addiction module RelE/StbE family toxin
MRVRWTRPALLQLADIHDYIAAENPAAARRVVRQIRQETTILTTQSGVGRPGRVPGTRELVVNRYPYVVAYRVDAAEIPILAVLHTSRRWPSEMPSRAGDV